MKKIKKYIKIILNYIEFTFNKPKWIILIALFSIYIIFKNGIESLIDNKIVRPFLNDLEYRLIEDYIFYVFFTIIVTVFVNRFRRNYRVNTYRLFIFSALTLIYIYYRNFSFMWDFSHLQTLKVFYYFDIIIAYVVLQLILIVKNCLTIERAIIIKDNIPFILDEPLKKGSVDKLKREEDANDIAERLKVTKSDKAIAIGILGEWGFGKSSFFTILKDKLEVDENNILIDFNPWRGYKDNALSVDFFESLSQAVGNHSDLLKGNIKRYSETLLNIDNNLFQSTLNFGVDIFQINSIEAQHQEINNALKKIDRNFYVFIDDLDRLSTKEIIEIIKLVRNTADFYNLKFILAYDKSYLVNALKGINTYNFENYLEKIILFEYHLTPLESEHVNQELLILLDEYSKKEIKEEVKKLATRKNFEKNTLINLFLLSLRDVKRFANTFIPNYNKYYKEVDLIDFVNIELLKMKYPSIASLLFYRRNDFLSNRDNGVLTLSYTNDKKEKYSIEEYIEENKGYLQVENATKNKLLILIKALFTVDPIFESRIDEKSIRKGKNFSNYFRKETSANSISHTEFENVLDSSIDIILERFKIWVEQEKRGAIFDKLKNYNPFDKKLNKEQYEKLIKAIFIAANLDGSNDYFFAYSNDDIHTKFYYKKRIVKEIYNDNEINFKEFVISVFDDATFPYKGESEFLSYLSDRLLTDDFILNQTEVEKYLIQYFKSYCDLSKVLDGNFWMLYNNCKKGTMEGNTITKVYLPEANEIHKQFIFKSTTILKSYLENVIMHNDYNGDVYAINGSVAETYNGFLSFKSLLEASKYSNEDFVKEFIEFYLVFATQDCKKYVPFRFVKIKVK